MRLINADAVMDKACENLRDGDVLDRIPPSFIDNAPTVDAVPVVRCRDCKNWLPGGYKSIADPQNPQCGGRCWYSNISRFENDFCSYGERKEANNA